MELTKYYKRRLAVILGERAFPLLIAASMAWGQAQPAPISAQPETKLPLPSAGKTDPRQVVAPPPGAIPAIPPIPAIKNIAIPTPAAWKDQAVFRDVVEARLGEVKRYLADGGKVDVADSGGYTPLMYAVSYLHRSIFQELLKAGANPNQEAKDGQTPLNLAVETAALGMIQDLLKAGADVKGKGRFIPLQSALCLGHPGVIRLLLASGADPNLQGASKIAVRALAQATDMASAPLASELVKAGANPNSRSRMGDTALTQATIMGSPSMVKKLVSEGTDKSLQNQMGKTASDYALEGGIGVKKALESSPTTTVPPKP